MHRQDSSVLCDLEEELNQTASEARAVEDVEALLVCETRLGSLRQELQLLCDIAENDETETDEEEPLKEEKLAIDDVLDDADQNEKKDDDITVHYDAENSDNSVSEDAGTLSRDDAAVCTVSSTTDSDIQNGSTAVDSQDDGAIDSPVKHSNDVTVDTKEEDSRDAERKYLPSAPTMSRSRCSGDGGVPTGDPWWKWWPVRFRVEDGAGRQGELQRGEHCLRVSSLTPHLTQPHFSVQVGSFCTPIQRY